MAAAIIPIVAAAVSAIAPQIPSIVQFVEGLFGHSSNTGKQDGAAKLETAVTILQNALVALANAGKLPSATVLDPNLPAGLAGAVQQAFDALKAAGLFNAPTTPVVPSPTPTPAPVGGKTITITGVLYGG